MNNQLQITPLGIDIFPIYQSSSSDTRLIPSFEFIYREYSSSLVEEEHQHLLRVHDTLKYAVDKIKKDELDVDVNLIEQFIAHNPVRPEKDVFFELLRFRYSFDLPFPEQLGLEDIDMSKRLYNMPWKEVW